MSGRRSIRWILVATSGAFARRHHDQSRCFLHLANSLRQVIRHHPGGVALLILQEQTRLFSLRHRAMADEVQYIDPLPHGLRQPHQGQCGVLAEYSCFNSRQRFAGARDLAHFVDIRQTKLGEVARC